MNIVEKVKIALKNANETEFLQLLLSVTNQELKAVFDADKWTLCQICELGYSSTLEHLLDLQILNVNDTYYDWTPIQYACKAGHSEIVKHLLKWDAVVKQDVWKEDSEFYLVSFHGHLDAAKILYEKYKDLVEDSDICYGLLYAACQGGHLPLVHMWLRPGHDINQLVSLVPSLDQCEFCYPLFAACQGKHMEVAVSLIKDCGACLKREIGEYFTDFTAKLVKSLCLVSPSKRELLFCLTKINLEYPLSQWFYPNWNKDNKENNENHSDYKEEEEEEEEEENLSEIIIFSVGNFLQQLSSEVLWHLPGLVQLDVSNNPFLTIERPLRPSELITNRLVALDVSHCEMESISSYLFMLPCLEDLNLSHNKLGSLDSSDSLPPNGKWKCERLKFFNVSYNNLIVLPYGLQGCSNMDSLIADHNQLVSLCPPWTCSLTVLNVSHNKLGSFPPSAEHFWRNSLKHIFIQHNEFDELPSTIVALDSLRHLNASNNKISKIPAGEKWRCQLFYLNLSHNVIGTDVRKASLSRVMSVKNEGPPKISFIGASMSKTLTELYLGDNRLKFVPEGIADMANLSLLDLKKNPAIVSLPHELGRLQKLLVLELEDISVEDKELQLLIASLNRKENSARDVIMYLERKRRNCIPSDIFKVVILGKGNKIFEQSLIQQLAHRKGKSETVPVVQHEEMLVTQIPIVLRRGNWRTSCQWGHAAVWEFPAVKFSSSVLPCFLTLNTLYLLQFEIDPRITPVSKICFKDLLEKVTFIQACVLRPEILVVLTFPEGTSNIDIQSAKNELSQRQQQFDFSRVKVFTLSAKPRNLSEQLDKLWEEVENFCMTMNDARFEKKRSLAQRKVPKSFLQVYQRVVQARETENLHVCTMEKFLEIIKCTCKDLKDCMEPEYNLEEFLLQNGAILHYSNFNQDLSNCVFLDPAWLFNILTTFLKSLTINQAKLSETEVKKKMGELLPSDYDYFPGFLALLETFNIGFRIVDSKNNNILVIPSLLQKHPPSTDLPEYPNSLKATRLYPTPTLPLAFWNHVISQLIAAFNRFSQSYWKFGYQSGDSQPGMEFKLRSGVESHKSFKMSRNQSLMGLKLSDKNVQFWRTGIFIIHDQGYMVVEKVECNDKSDEKTPGILVTVQTNESIDIKENLRKLAVIGIVRDELEEILEMFIPKFSDPLAAELKPFVLCPYCHKTTPMLGYVNIDGIHFTARDCAQEMLKKDIIVCQGGPTSLRQLVPELFFLELPEIMCLDFKDLKLNTDEKLGRGIAGEVLKGYFKEQEVAIKVFHQHHGIYRDMENSHSAVNTGQVHYNNCHPQTSTAEQTQQVKDRLESEQRKISNAFSEVRREVGILSKLQHRCVVTFLGVCVQPHLMLVMELAPLGSLRSELERRLAMKVDQLQVSTGLHGNSKVISEMVFSKNLTYKMVLQITSGISHLHSHQIIFRDLKPDNILLMSLEETDPINVKLSDYGISKFASLQGTSGLFGTVGYIAPEVLTKQAYTKKVDIFSLGIVMGEVLTGIPPVGPDQSSKVSDIGKDSIYPGHMQGYEVHCNFPCLEELMKECWSPRSEIRPEAADIVKKMKAKRFLLMHDSIWLDESAGLEVTCIYTCESNGRWIVWICESGPGCHRFFSVYDIKANCFSLKRMESSQGPAVTVMLKVGAKIWLACQGERMLFTLTRGSDRMFEIFEEILLDDIPTKLISFDFKQIQGELILAGLQDGSLTSFHRSICGKAYTISKVKLEEQDQTSDSEGLGIRRETGHGEIKLESYPVACICQVGTLCVAVASGADIHTFQVNHGDMSATGNGCVDIISNRAKISLDFLTEGFVPISSMASEGEKVECDSQFLWCCMTSAPFLVQVDVLNSQVILVLNISWSQGQDFMCVERHLPFFSSQRGHRSFKMTSDHSGTDHKPTKMRCATTFSVSAQGTSRSPPPIPPRQTSIECDISLHSLTISGDVLMIGTNCGGLLALPLASIDSPDGIFRGGGLSLQLEIFWHQQDSSFAHHGIGGFRQRGGSTVSSLSTTNCLSVARSTRQQIPTGEITLLLQAGTKMLSICTHQEKAIRRPRTISRGMSKQNTLQNTGSFPVVIPEDIGLEGWDFVDSETEGTSLLSASKSSCSSKDISNITVWDHISSEKLITIEEYGLGLS